MKISEALKKAAAACVVRECDEEQPGRYVSYVDEGDASFDVTLELDADRQPLTGSCDCESKKPCRHIAALYLFVSEGKTVSTKLAPAKLKKKKQTPLEEMLDRVDNIALREWVGQAIAKSKELELSFMSRFRPADASISAADATRISDDAIKSVLGRARHVDPSQLKRILKLWKELHKPVIERYRAAPAEPSAFEPIHAIVEASIKLAEYHRGGIQAVRYAEEILHGLAPAVALLQQDEAFERAASFFIGKTFGMHSDRLPAYLGFTSGIREAVSGERLTWFARQLAHGFQQIDAARRELYNWHAFEILSLAIDTGTFAGFAEVFPRIAGSDRYNLSLLNALAKAGAYQRALDLGWTMFKSARYETPVELFLEPLVDVAVKLGDRDAELRIRQELFQRTFRLEDFEVVTEAAPDSAAKKRLEKKLLAFASVSSRFTAGSFLAERYATAGDWKGFAEEIRRGKVLYSIIERHFGKMHQYSPELLLAALLDGNSASGGSDMEQEQRAFEAVVHMVMDTYGREQIAAATVGTPEHSVKSYYRNVLSRSLVMMLEDSGSPDQ